jgi:hypothetical protein
MPSLDQQSSGKWKREALERIDLEDVKCTSALAFTWFNFRAVSRKVEKGSSKAERNGRGRTLRRFKSE